MKKIVLIPLALVAALVLGFAVYRGMYTDTLQIVRQDIDYIRLSCNNRAVAVEDAAMLDELVQKLNRLRFRPYRDMSHMDPRSDVVTVSVYGTQDEPLDVIWFYDWAYRGGEHEGKNRQEGQYLMPVKNPRYHQTIAYLRGLLEVE